MMKLACLIICLLGIVLAEDTYESIDDNFDISEVLENNRLLQAYARCLLSRGPCTPEIKKVKDKIPEVLETRCAKCTDKQKVMGKKLAQGVKSKHPDIWAELVHTYDPDGKYQDAFEDYFKN